MPRTRLFPAHFTALFLLAGCGGTKPPADATQAGPPAQASASAPIASAAVAEPSASATDAGGGAPHEPAATEPASPPSSEPAAIPLAQRLLAPAMSFMIDYNDSAPHQAADATCSAKAGSDPAAKSTCMEKERARFVADVLAFRIAGKGVTLTIYRRQGNSLDEMSKSDVELGDESGGSLHVKVKSDKGARPLFAGKKEIIVSVASESSIAIDDPKLGKLVYDARIGLVNEPSP